MSSFVRFSSLRLCFKAVHPSCFVRASMGFYIGRDVIIRHQPRFFIHDRKTQKRPFFCVRFVRVLICARERFSLGSLSLQSGSGMVFHIGGNVRFLQVFGCERFCRYSLSPFCSMPPRMPQKRPWSGFVLSV